jgi:hypothetical protein
MVQAFDHRAASVTVNPANVHRPAQTDPATEEQHADPNWLPSPQFWISTREIDWPIGLQWAVGFKEITAATNARTMIATIVPRSGYGNKLPLFLPDAEPARANEGIRAFKAYGPLLAANFNAFAFDFIVRQKLHAQTLNLFIVEQLSVLPQGAYERAIGNTRADALVRDEVLHLTYTATDMESFARDMGFEGDPFAWDEEDRLHRRCRLDALYFMMYGLDGDTAAYILDTFPIVREDDTERFGRYLTKDLILAYMRAFEAGDARSRVAV